MGNASQINRSRNSVRVERRSDLNESDLGEVYCICRFKCLTGINPFRLSYVYIRTKFPNRCDSCTYIYVHGLCDRNMGLLTDTLRYHHTVHTRYSRPSGLQPAAILQHVYQRKKSGVYSELSAVFGKFWKITIVGPSSIHRLVWNTTAHYMDFLP